MLVQARTTVALRCARCGRLEMETVSRFEVRSGASVRVACGCGRHMMTVGFKGDQVYLQVPCYLCDGTHFAYYGRRDFWADDLKEIICSETELQLGVFGGESHVTSYANPGASELERLLEDRAFDDYFNHREVMYQTLNRIHSLTDEGKVHCKCGSSRIAIDLYPDKLELTCEDCESVRTLFAGSEEDLSALEGLPRIEVGGDKPPHRRGRKRQR